ncbi:MAG: hypothetical protein K8R53_02040 [Bacteroidales bacterium]|nr:hypothetical protein [Bacteroidales bacterium]
MPEKNKIQDLAFEFLTEKAVLWKRYDKKGTVSISDDLVEEFGYTETGSTFFNRLTSWHVARQTEYTNSYYDNGNILNKSDVTEASGTFELVYPPWVYLKQLH